MKKYLFLSLALLVGLSSISAPWDIKSKPVRHLAWDKPLEIKKVFSDPYVTNYGAYVIGTFSSPNYACQIQISFNQSVPVPYYAIVQVLGLWGGSTSASYREFTILFSSGQWNKSVNFPMSYYEEAYTSVIDLLDYGPQ